MYFPWFLVAKYLSQGFKKVADAHERLSDEAAQRRWDRMSTAERTEYLEKERTARALEQLRQQQLSEARRKGAMGCLVFAVLFFGAVWMVFHYADRKYQAEQAAQGQAAAEASKLDQEESRSYQPQAGLNPETSAWFNKVDFGFDVGMSMNDALARANTLGFRKRPRAIDPCTISSNELQADYHYAVTRECELYNSEGILSLTIGEKGLQRVQVAFSDTLYPSAVKRFGELYGPSLDCQYECNWKVGNHTFQFSRVGEFTFATWFS